MIRKPHVREVSVICFLCGKTVATISKLALGVSLQKDQVESGMLPTSFAGRVTLAAVEASMLSVKGIPVISKKTC